ncbi:conserved hypothetical protein [Chlamydia pecorum E58]|uniref:Uncharacterized protein n=1 Tax=Chlamydia pecorum (strain ATCC VR-628 / DSM 29919 / E58) TaxID=331635 RepID=A0AA34RDZ8_CHLPE|nr:conserved hypothetical protein [Chlamydia pecorum E58]
MRALEHASSPCYFNTTKLPSHKLLTQTCKREYHNFIDEKKQNENFMFSLLCYSPLKEAFAPASCSFFTVSSASSLEVFSLTVFGKPSVISLASFKAKPVISRTTFNTPIFLSAGTSSKITANSVGSAEAASPPAAAPAPAIAITGAAAVTSHFSSNNFFN